MGPAPVRRPSRKPRMNKLRLVLASVPLVALAAATAYAHNAICDCFDAAADSSALRAAVALVEAAAAAAAAVAAAVAS